LRCKNEAIPLNNDSSSSNNNNNGNKTKPHFFQKIIKICLESFEYLADKLANGRSFHY